MSPGSATSSPGKKEFKYLSFYAKDFKEFALSKINKNNFYFLDKKTSTMIKTYLKKNYRISRLDFEKNV